MMGKMVKMLRVVWDTVSFVQRVQGVALFVWKTTTLLTLSLLCHAVITIMTRVSFGGYSRYLLHSAVWYISLQCIVQRLVYCSVLISIHIHRTVQWSSHYQIACHSCLLGQTCGQFHEQFDKRSTNVNSRADCLSDCQSRGLMQLAAC